MWLADDGYRRQRIPSEVYLTCCSRSSVAAGACHGGGDFELEEVQKGIGSKSGYCGSARFDRSHFSHRRIATFLIPANDHPQGFPYNLLSCFFFGIFRPPISAFYGNRLSISVKSSFQNPVVPDLADPTLQSSATVPCITLTLGSKEERMRGSTSSTKHHVSFFEIFGVNINCLLPFQCKSQ